MAVFEQQRGHSELVQVLAGVVITGCESFLSSTVLCGFHVVLTHSLLGEGHVGQTLTDMSNEHTLSGKHGLCVYHQVQGDSIVAHSEKTG